MNTDTTSDSASISSSMEEVENSTISQESTSPKYSNLTFNENDSFWQLCIATMRAGIFLNFHNSESPKNLLNVARLIVLSVLLQFLGDLINIGLKGQLSLFGLPGVLYYVPICLLTAVILARICRQLNKVWSLLTIFCGIYLVSQIFYLAFFTIYQNSWLSSSFPNWNYWFYYFLYTWFALAYGVASCRILHLKKMKALIVTIFCGLLIQVLLLSVYRESTLWMAQYDPTEGASNELYDALNHEDVLFSQPKLLAQELDRVLPSESEQSQLFLVALAGYADQDVFMKEVKFVDELFLRRFNTRNHRVRLINNPSTVDQFPIASVTGLQMALDRVGKVMRTEKDVLFLYLSSHGSENHEVSLDFGSMRFKSLNPATLNQMLNQAGIKNRVIVVSTCYSGGFIDLLKNDYSLIITSSAKNKKSFGCSNDADYTYFGKAFFVDALKQKRSFIDAFTQALPEILQREKDEKYIPSEPQMFIGEKILPILNNLYEGDSSKIITEQAQVKTIVEMQKSNTQDDKMRLSLAGQLEMLFNNDLVISEYSRICNEYQSSNTAEKLYANNHDFFGGLSPKSPLWPKVVTILRDFQKESCKGMDLTTYRESIITAFAQSHSTHELEELIKFYKSNLGKKSIEATLFANNEIQKQVFQISNTLNERASLNFSQEIGALIAQNQRTKSQR